MRVLILTDIISENEVTIQGPQYLNHLIKQGLNVRELLKNGYFELTDTLIEIAPEKSFIDFTHKKYLDC